MAHKFKLKDVGMDTMEILYYERQAKSKKKKGLYIKKKEINPNQRKTYQKLKNRTEF